MHADPGPWAVEGMVVTGKFRRAPDPSGSNFTVANIHINNECAEPRSVCLAPLLLIPDLCLMLGAVVLTGDFNKAVERETLTAAFRRLRKPSAVSFCFLKEKEKRKMERERKGKGKGKERERKGK